MEQPCKLPPDVSPSGVARGKYGQYENKKTISDNGLAAVHIVITVNSESGC